MRDPIRTAFAALAFGVGALWPGMTWAGAAQATETARTSPPAPETVAQLATWAIASGDNRDLPFVIIDKVAAEVFVFTADGRLAGAAPALLGLAHGDDSAPGVGDRKLSAIPPDERTTPAGRFLAAWGLAPGGGRVLWVDYATAISLHPVVRGSPQERRLQRLTSSSPDDNRITYGCINVPGGFYEKVVRPAFTGVRGVVYILPETRLLEEVFPAFRAQARTVAASTAAATSAGSDAASAR
ncbi:L,D-transpeptidase [Phenylobacterium sp. LjRoot225]|uniref:L,D-transpeptidase n=1 Tax=Phenylobacterium sp. LjRoot225 TaxID=3342285 RepID=UPI003ECD3F80